MNKKLLVSFTATLALVLPFFALAIEPIGLPGIIPGPWIVINRVLSFIWPLFIGFAVIMFIVAGLLFLSAQGDPGKVRDARNAVVWGVVGVVVGIISFSLPYLIISSLLF